MGVSFPLAPMVYVKEKVMTMKDDCSYVARVAARELKRKLKKANKKKAEGKSIKNFGKER